MHPKVADSRPSRRRHPRRNRQNATRTAVLFPAPAAVNNDRSSTGIPQYVTMSLPHAVASQHLYTVESPSYNLLLIQGCNRSRTTRSTSSTGGGKFQSSPNCSYASTGLFRSLGLKVNPQVRMCHQRIAVVNGVKITM